MGAKLGQNFLTDPNILRKIIALTVPDATQTVVEVGCGDGILTRALLDKAKKLYVIEIDETCITKTKEKLGMSLETPDESSATGANGIQPFGWAQGPAAPFETPDQSLSTGVASKNGIQRAEDLYLSRHGRKASRARSPLGLGNPDPSSAAGANGIQRAEPFETPDERSAKPSAHPIFILGDVLEVGFQPVALEDRPFRIIANIPYYISAKFIALCAAHKHDLTDVTLMLQWEFAKKLVSKPGESGYTPLAIFAQMHFDIRLDFQVSRHCFRPAPKVDSAIVTLTPKELPEDLVHDEGFFLFVKAVFWGRRKPLKSALHKSPYWTVKEGYITHPIWETLGSTRAEILSREQLLDTYRVLVPYLERVVAFKRREVLDLA